MVLIIEDGSNVAGAEAYADVSAFEAWETAYFGAAVVAAETDKEAAIRRAVAFMDGLPWRGERAHGRGQALAWPRSNVVDDEGRTVASNAIPDAVIFAQHVLSKAEIESPGVLAPQVDRSAHKVLNKVGEIGWKVMAVPGVAAARPVNLMAMDALRGLLKHDFAAPDAPTSEVLRA